MKESRRLIEVCGACCCSSCWHGEFMCGESQAAGTTLKTVANLDELAIENEDHYSRGRMLKVYGTVAPHGYAKAN